MKRKAGATPGFKRAVWIAAPIVLASAVLWIVYAQSSAANAKLVDQASDTLSSTLYNSLKRDGLIPIVRPGAHAVGGVYRVSTGDWFKEAGTCFPHLPAPTSNGSTLPDVVLDDLREAGLALGINKLIDGEAASRLGTRAIIQYADPLLVEVPENSLLESFDPVACPELASLMKSISEDSSPDDDGRRFLVIRQLYKARRVVKIEADTASMAQEKLRLASKLSGLEGKVEANSSGHFSVVMSNPMLLPVAVRPAYILVPNSATLGTHTDPTNRVTWENFDPLSMPADLDYFYAQVSPAFEAKAKQSGERKN